MIYKEIDQFTPSLKIHSDKFILVDLSRMERGELNDAMMERAEELKCSPHLLRSKLIDAFISIDDLGQKVTTVVLSWSDWSRPVHLPPEPTGTVLQYLTQKYQKHILLGLKINSGQSQKLIESVQGGELLKKIKLFSFDLTHQDLDNQMAEIQKIIHYLIQKSKKYVFHINFALHNASDLKKFKKWMLLYSLPIEYVCLQTNLLDIIETESQLNMGQDWQEIAFKYLQAINKYVPSAVGCLLQSAKTDTELQLEGLFRCLNLINKRCENEGLQQKQYKKYHKTGVTVPAKVYQSILQSFSPSAHSSLKVRAAFDSIFLVKLHKVLMGKYNSILSHPQ